MQLGIGTQRVEEELTRLFPDVRVARMDLDTTTEKNAHHRILERFGEGRADILLGTQMVAKGLDFGNVSLVGIISADTGLQLPDIRAEERTFQLLTQVAGRAGRAELPGEVILQTYNPGHRVIQYAMQHDYLRFADNVLPERSALRYPPYGKILALLVSGPSESMVNRLAMQWCDAARSIEASLEILGPSPSFIGRVRKNHRAQVLIKVDPAQSHRAVRQIIRQTNTSLGSPPKHYRIAVDVDPVGLA
jgi:primosomal protein N' (replication factor Y) (superfamily II helicase)